MRRPCGRCRHELDGKFATNLLRLDGIDASVVSEPWFTKPHSMARPHQPIQFSVHHKTTEGSSFFLARSRPWANLNTKPLWTYRGRTSMSANFSSSSPNGPPPELSKGKLNEERRASEGFLRFHASPCQLSFYAYICKVSYGMLITGQDIVFCRYEVVNGLTHVQLSLPFPCDSVKPKPLCQ